MNDHQIPDPARHAVYRAALALGMIISASLATACNSRSTTAASLTGPAPDPAPRPAVNIQPCTIETHRGPARGYIAHIDLAQVQLIVTEPAPPTPSDPPGTETHLLSTLDWATQQHAAQNLTLAINANYFGKLKPVANIKHEGPAHWAGHEPVDVIGIWASNGVIHSPPRVHNGRGDPAFVIDATGPHIGYFTPADLDGVQLAVAGVGGGEGDTLPGTLLIENGQDRSEAARVAPQVRHPRTAIGLTPDRQTLIIAVFDGRQPNWSIGLTLPELAAEMQRRGAYNALNLDGGGSSAFIFFDEKGRIITNQPSDPGHAFRPVATHLGVVPK